MFIQIGIFLKDNLAHPLFFFPEATTTCLTYFYLIFHPWALLIEFPVWKMNILLFFSFSPTLTIPSAHLISTLPSSKDIMVMLSFWIDKIFQLSSFRSLSHVRLFVTPWTAALQASLSMSSWSLLKLMPIELVMPANHLILCRPLLLLPSIIPSVRVFSNESVLYIRWPKYWCFRFNTSPSSEYSGLISFRMDWLDLLAIQGTLKNLLQHHSSKASILHLSSQSNSHTYTWPLEKP